MLKNFSALILILWLTTSCSNLKNEKITIFHAGSLAVTMRELTKAFENKYPNVKIERETAGSLVSARKVSELKKPADVVAVADYRVIDNLLKPEFADWNIKFAKNQMVIAYNSRSKFNREINESNWYKILLRPGVEYGHSDPNADPCGYRTLMLWQLAEEYYHEPELYEKLTKKRPLKNIRPKETDLIVLVESGELDYMFQYLSVAKQHGFSYVELPKEIDLSDYRLANFYQKASVKISGKKPGDLKEMKGAAIVYGITISKNSLNPAGAIKFIKFMLSSEGQEIVRRSGQVPLAPAASADFDRLPQELKVGVRKDE